MIKWCAYCQKFQGEVPPYNEYSITHGMCGACASIGLDLSESQMARVKQLSKIQDMLFIAGANEDHVLAKKMVAEAREAGFRDVDLLMGVIAPLLWKVGDLWEKGQITVADEHRFTAFYESIVREYELPHIQPDSADVVLINAPGNVHYLGLRVLHMWLGSNGISSVIIKHFDVEKNLDLIIGFKAKVIGFSVATGDQLESSKRLVNKLREIPSLKSVRYVIGGSLIKRGSYLDTGEILFLSDVNDFLKVLSKN